MVTFVGKQQASKTLDLSGETLKRYRLEGKWIEGIHWVRLNSRCVRYNLELNQWYEPRGKPRSVFRPKGRGMYPKRFKIGSTINMTRLLTGGRSRRIRRHY